MTPVSVLSWNRLKKSLRHFPAVVKQYFLIFVVMHVINLFFNQMMIYLQELRMTSKDDMYIPLMLLIAFVGFVVQSIIRTIWTFTVCHFFQNKSSLGDFLRRHLEQGLIESLRAFFRAVLWGFVFIFPGFHKFIRYQFALYVVGLDEAYDRGEKDALEESVQASKGHFMGLATILTLFSILSIFTTSSFLIFQNPVEVILVETLGFALITLQTMYFLFLYQDLKAPTGRAA